MKIHEYQAKDILKEFGIKIPKGWLCKTKEDIDRLLDSLPAASVWVVKAQIHAGGRGQGGGVLLAYDKSDLKEKANKVLGMTLVTKQTDPEGSIARSILIEESNDISQELYASIIIDRANQNLCFIVSDQGGMDIEEVAEKTPDKIHKVWFTTREIPSVVDLNTLACKLDIPETCIPSLVSTWAAMIRAFIAYDAELLEVNPLIVHRDQTSIIALDAKATFDENALFKHPNILAMRDIMEDDELSVRASSFGLSYVSLSGNVGCMVNGAGLSMATMDLIKHYGGEPANFLDLGGGADLDSIVNGFELMLENENVKSILVNIFGGIMRCDLVAQAITISAHNNKRFLKLPLILNMKGNNDKEANEILSKSGITYYIANNMKDGAKKAVEAARGQ